MPYRNFAERTRIEYQNDLESLVGFLEQLRIYHVNELGLPTIERFVAHLEQDGFASLTRKRKVVSIRSFLSFLYQDGYIETNLAKKVILPFAEYPSQDFLTQSECNKLRSVCTDNPRDTAIIQLILQTGIKLSELVRLTVNDIEFEESGRLKGFMGVKGSIGKRDWIIPLDTKATEAITNYLEVRNEVENDVLFLNRFGEPQREWSTENAHKTYKKCGNWESYIARGTDPKTVKDVMGYKDEHSVAIYQSLSREVVSRELQDHALYEKSALIKFVKKVGTKFCILTLSKSLISEVGNELRADSFSFARFSSPF